MFKLSLSIPLLPESLNKGLRAHRFARDRDNKAWDSLIWAETRSNKPAAPIKRARLSLVRHSHRMLDFDGVVGSMKPVVDALVTAGILADDRWSVLGAWHVDQVFRAKALGPLLEIRVEELRPG